MLLIKMTEKENGTVKNTGLHGWRPSKNTSYFFSYWPGTRTHISRSEWSKSSLVLRLMHLKQRYPLNHYDIEVTSILSNVNLHILSYYKVLFRLPLDLYGQLWYITVCISTWIIVHGNVDCQPKNTTIHILYVVSHCSCALELFHLKWMALQHTTWPPSAC